MLVDCGIGLVELGHSERRTHFGETDHTVELKIAAALKHGITPRICVGETAEQIGRADDVLVEQVRAALSNNARILTMGARVIDPELAKAIVDTWLPLQFDPMGRSAGNVAAIGALDQS